MGLFVSLQFALRDVGKTLCVNRLDYAAVLDDVCEHLELAVLENVGEVLQFDSEARVGLVHAVAVHGVAVLHAGEGRGNVHSEGVLPDFFEHVFDKRVHVFAVDEAKLDIDLRKFGLAVCAEVFVAEAFSHLVVAFDARYHQHLLVLLGRLVERVEHAGICAAGPEEFARAFGRALEKNGGFDFDEILRVEVVADSLCRLVAHAQKVEVARSAEVEIAVLEAEVFVDPVGVFVVEGEGEHVADVVYYHVGRDDFDFARFEVRVFSAVLPEFDFAENLDYAFVFEFLRLFVDVRRFGVEDDLRYAVAVAKVDE